MMYTILNYNINIEQQKKKFEIIFTLTYLGNFWNRLIIIKHNINKIWFITYKIEYLKAFI